jgi:sulfur transfer protein SufE
MNSTMESHPSITEKKLWQLNALDRCDSCQSQAFIKAEGKNGCLYFCGHHYNKIVNNPSGYANLMAFAFNIIDEREKLKEK